MMQDTNFQGGIDKIDLNIALGRESGEQSFTSSSSMQPSVIVFILHTVLVSHWKLSSSAFTIRALTFLECLNQTHNIKFRISQKIGNFQKGIDGNDLKALHSAKSFDKASFHPTTTYILHFVR